MNMHAADENMTFIYIILWGQCYYLLPALSAQLLMWLLWFFIDVKSPLSSSFTFTNSCWCYVSLTSLVMSKRAVWLTKQLASNYTNKSHTLPLKGSNNTTQNTLRKMSKYEGRKLWKGLFTPLVSYSPCRGARCSS